MSRRLSTIVFAALLGIAHPSVAGPVPPSSPSPPADQRKIDCAVAGQLASSASLIGDISMILFEYQKMAASEARSDNKIDMRSKEIALQQKSAKLASDNSQMDAQKQEADRKADNLMSAATVSLAVGIASASAGAFPDLASAYPHNVQDLQRFMSASDGLKRDLARLRDEVKRSHDLAKGASKRAGISTPDVDRMIGQLAIIERNLNTAKRTARPCPGG
jgi:hypothetical protein